MTSPGGSGGGDLGVVRGKIVIDAKDAEKGADQAGDALDKFEKKAKSSGDRGLRDAANLAQGYGVVVAGGIALAVTAAANFEQALANVAAAGGKDAANQMEAVRAKALQLGADTKFSATEAAAAMEVLIKSGLSVEDVLNGAADAAVNLAAAEGIGIPEAAEIAAVAMTAFNLTASQMPDIANKISQAASATKMDVNDFSQAMNQAGAVSKLVGLSFEDMTLAITAMGKAGIVGSDAGTSLKTMLLNLQPSTKPAREAMMDLGIVTKDGANKFYDATGRIKSMTEISEVLYQATSKLTPAQRQMALETMFGSDAIRAAAIIAERGAKGMNDLTSEMQGQLSVAEKARVKQDTLQGSLEKLKGSVETAAIQFGTAFIPVLRTVAGWLEKVADWFAKLPAPVKEALAWVAAITAGLVLFGAGIYALTKAFKAMAVGLQVIGLALKANPIILIASIIAALIIAIMMNWDQFSAWFVARWEWLKSTAITIWTAVKDFFIGVWTAIKDFFVMIWTSIRDFFVGFWNFIVGENTNATETFRQTWERHWNNIKNFFVTIFTAIWDFLKYVWNGIKDGTLEFLSAVGSWIRDRFNGAVQEAKNIWNGLVSFISSIPSRILSALGNFKSLLTSLGRDLLEGLWRGIKDAASWLWNKITGLVGDVFNFIKMKLGIGSPSKITMQYGEWLTIGLAKGVTNELSSLKESVGKMGSVIAPALAPYIPPAAAAVGSAALDRTGAMSTGQTVQSGNTFVIEHMEMPIKTIADSTNPVEWRKTMVAIRDAIDGIQREYGQ